MAIIQHPTDDNRQSLEEENKRLKSILDGLVSKAEINSAIQKKFHRLEFDLLNTSSLPFLLEKLTGDFKSRFDVEAISLILHDPYSEVVQLLDEIYPDTELNHITFTNELSQIEQFYELGNKVQIRQKNFFISDKLFEHGHLVQSFILLPLVRNGLLIGSYHLGSHSPERFTPEMSTDFYQHFSQVVSICIENTINNEKLKHLSLTDPLTKTRNRRCLYQSLDKEIARAERELIPLSCLFIDLDHFKQINDQYGHATGDHTLEHIAKIILPNLRTTDLLARYGGEEFAVILPNCEATEAMNIAERIRKMVAEQQLISTQGKPYRLTCSIGCTTWDPVRHSDSDQKHNSNQTIAESLITAADKAAYFVKSNGRNASHWNGFTAESN